MPMFEEPVVGAFYEDEDGRTFEVISFDENIGTLEIRYGENTPQTIDLDDWYGMDLERKESEEEVDDDLDEPDNSAGSDDDADLDDDDYTDEEE